MTKKDVLQDVSFTAKEGEITALVGPPAPARAPAHGLPPDCGDVTRGSIQVGGVDISTVEPEVLLSDYSMVFQDVVLFDDTVMENIRLGKHGPPTRRCLPPPKAANCDEFVRRLPKGYRTPSGKTEPSSPAASASAFHRPGALKGRAYCAAGRGHRQFGCRKRNQGAGALSRLLAGKTVLVIAHRMRTVEAADKIVVWPTAKRRNRGP